MVSTKQITLTPARNGISHLSPNTILTGTQVDIDKYYEIPFGAHVIVKPDSQQEHVDDRITAILLCPSNVRTSHEVLDLNTGRIMTGYVDQQVSITDLTIKTIEDIAVQEGKSMTYHNTDWIAGVNVGKSETKVNGVQTTETTGVNNKQNQARNEAYKHEKYKEQPCDKTDDEKTPNLIEETN